MPPRSSAAVLPNKLAVMGHHALRFDMLAALQCVSSFSLAVVVKVTF